MRHSISLRNITTEYEAEAVACRSRGSFFGVFGRALTGNVLMYLDSERNIANRKENRIM